MPAEAEYAYVLVGYMMFYRYPLTLLLGSDYSPLQGA